MKTVAAKYDDDKAMFDLIPGGPLSQLAEVYTMGAKKYAPRNWEKGLKWGRVYAAIMRHLWAYWMGEDTDKESGKSHLAHAAWGCFSLMEYAKTHPELDDRPGKTHPFKAEARQTDMLFDANGGSLKTQWMDTKDLGVPGMAWVGHDQDLQVRT